MAEPTAKSNAANSSDETYTMKVDLAVLDSLGINLYSNAAAVLSEIVANAYDADSTLVEISWNDGGTQVVVADDGTGMSVDELNKRFLTVGYKKRSKEGSKSKKWDRPFMGRKGIGKLSVFSIAETVSVYSTKAGESNGLRIDVEELREAIRAGDDYHPTPIDVPDEYQRKGTIIVLDDLKSKRTKLTSNALRKRLARRFDVMDQTPRSNGGFQLEVDGKRITWKDREELKKLEFIWEFGSKTLPDSALPKGIKRFVLPDNTVGKRLTWKVTGWIGTVKKPAHLTADKESGSLKNVIVLARKRPIQEGIVEKLDFNKLFGNYVTGQIQANFLDMDGKYDDIATSDRQRLLEDDERVVALQAFLREAFGKAAEKWSQERPKVEAKDTLEKYPKLREWVDDRPDMQKPAAEKMIGTIASLELEEGADEDRLDLLRAGVLAFERVGIRALTKDFEALGSVTAEALLPLLGQQDVYEASLWADILRSRVEAIDQLQHLTEAKELEEVLQKHLYKHLWLLDPAWERASLGGEMEEHLNKLAENVSGVPGFLPKDTNGKKIQGRIDIRYATAAQEHVIVELKKFERKVDTDELYDQGFKYHEALNSVLEKEDRADEPVSVVFVLGSKPTTKKRTSGFTEKEYIDYRFAPIHARVVLYNRLISNARSQYADYLEASAKADDLNQLIDDLGGN